jgi:hypothetical protein
MLGHLVSNAMHGGAVRPFWSLSAFVRRLRAFFRL